MILGVGCIKGWPWVRPASVILILLNLGTLIFSYNSTSIYLIAIDLVTSIGVLYLLFQLDVKEHFSSNFY